MAVDQQDLSTRKLSVATLGEFGDLGAAPGSREWSIAVRLKCQSLLAESERDTSNLAFFVDTMAEHEGYRQLFDPNGTPFLSWRSFCETRQPWGLGWSTEAITRLIREGKSAPERAATATLLTAHGGDRKSESHQGSVSTLNGKRDADYLSARIARDRPDILNRMKAGEYRSVRAAAIEAGIVPRTLTVRLDPQAAARTLRKHFTAEQLLAFIQALVTP